MVLFHDPDSPSPDDSSPDEEPLSPSPSASPCAPGNRLIISQAFSQRAADAASSVRTDVARHSARLDVAASHSIASLPREVERAGRNAVASPMPVRSVTSLRSLFDLAGSSRCHSNYSHGREIGGKSSVLALQVPASSLPPPFSASAVVDSFQLGPSSAFFPSLQSNEQRLRGAASSSRDSTGCVRCAPCQSSQAGPSSREGDHGNPDGIHGNTCSRGQGEIVRRLSEVLQGREDEDLILQTADRDRMMLQWLQALDLHVVGACRADERLRPMLRWNVSCCGADGRLLAHLSQHFKARELGLLARCLCAPLVTIRVGKVKRQGRFLCPTSSRGYLSLTMLPSSEMRLSFADDNGTVERIAAVKSCGEDAHVGLEMLLPDSSGRSFVVKLLGGRHVYFWQSEKSKATGDQMLSEMKDLLQRRPTLSQLSGVHDSRLNSFVSQLRSALATTSSLPLSSPPVGPTITADTRSIGPASALGSSSAPNSLRQSQRFCWSRTSPARMANNQPVIHGRAHSGNQGSLSPRANGFKEGAVRGTTNVRSIISSREKHRRRIDNSSSVSTMNFSSGQQSQSVHANPDLDATWSQLPIGAHVALSFSSDEKFDAGTHSAGLYTSLHPASFAPGAHGFSWDGDVPLPKQIFSVPLGSSSFPAPSLLPSLFCGSSVNSNTLHPPIPSHLPISTSTILAPYYCPCPLRSSALQYTITPPVLPSTSEISAVPSASSFFTVKPSSAFLSQTTISLDRVSLSPIPLPVSSLVNIPTPLQTPNLPPFFSDPIVHIPVIDFQSATQSFLVSAPPAISSSGIPPVLPNFLTSILPHAEGLSCGQELPALNIFQGLGVSSFKSEDQQNIVSDQQPLFIDSRFRALLASCPEGRLVKDGTRQDAETTFCSRLETSRSTVFDPLPQCSGPLLGMVPAILTSGSLSCVLNFCQERSSKATAWVSGSRGLYGGTCEPGIPARSISSCSLSLKAKVKDADVRQTKRKNISIDNADVILGCNSSDKDDGSEEDASNDLL